MRGVRRRPPENLNDGRAYPNDGCIEISKKLLKSSMFSLHLQIVQPRALQSVRKSQQLAQALYDEDHWIEKMRQTPTKNRDRFSFLRGLLCF